MSFGFVAGTAIGYGVAGSVGGALLGGAVGGALLADDPEIPTSAFTPTDLENELTRTQIQIGQQQLDVAQSQQSLTNLLLPIALEQIGYQGTFDAEGNLTGISETALSPEEQEMETMRTEIERGFLERTRAALAGELPVNPALLSDLADQEEDLRARLRKQLGSGFETSSPGIEALAEFGQRETEILEGARRGDLTLAEQLGLARQQQNQVTSQTQLANLLGFNAFQAGAAGNFSAAAATGQGVLGSLAQNRSLGANVAFQNANLQAQSQQGFGSLMGTILTAGTSGGGTILGDIFGSF